MSEGKVRVKKSITRNAVLNTINTIMTLVFPLITFPYSSRILGPTAIGKYNFGSSIITYFALMANLGVALYAVREGAKYRDDEEAITRFCNEVFSINMYSLVISYILLFLSLGFIGKLQPYTAVILIFSMRMMLNSLNVYWIYSIFEDFTYTTIVNMVMQVLAIAVMLLFVHSPADLNIYVFSSLMAYSGAGLFMFFHSRKYIKLRFIPKLNLKHLKPILIIFSLEIGAVIYVSSDVTLLSWIDGDDVTGLYSTSATIYKIIKQVLNAIVMVVVPRFSYHISKSLEPMDEGAALEHRAKADKLGSLLVNTMITIGIPASAGLYMMAPEIVTLCAGSEFAPAYSSLRILCFAILFAVLATFFGECVLMAFKQEKIYMIGTLVTALINVVLNIILIPKFHADAAAFTTVVAEFIMLVTTIYYSRKYYRIKIGSRVIPSSVIGSVLIVGICYFTRQFITNDILFILTGMAASVLAYLGICIGMKNDAVMSFIHKDTGI